MSDALHYRTIAELNAGFVDGSFTPVDVLEACLGRIEQLDGSYNAMAHVAADTARQQAQASATRWA